MSLRAEVRELVERGDLVAIEKLVASNLRAVRHLLALTYHADEDVRRVAARGVAISSRHHPKLVKAIVRRLVWAMNDESGTNALTAPAVVLAIARERAELLVPMVPDLIRLAGEEELSEGLSQALSTVTEACPGEVGAALQNALNTRMHRGGGPDDD
jgi:hypothetical protein